MAEKQTSLPAKAGMGMGGLGDLTPDALVESTKGQEQEKGSATGDALRDAMGNQKPRLEMVKVKGHGANLFQFEDGTKVPGEDGLLGVIVAFDRHNSWFGSPFGATEKGTLPLCFSNDAVSVAPKAESPQAKGCASCPRNRDARDRAARDAAFEAARSAPTTPGLEKGLDEVCNNYLSLAFALPGRDIPVRLRVTRQSFREWANYVQDIGTTKGRFLPHEVVTRITLQNKEGDSGEYSVAQFKYEGALPKHLRQQMEESQEAYSAILRRDSETDDREDTPSSTGAEAMEAAKAQANAAASEEAAL